MRRHLHRGRVLGWLLASILLAALAGAPAQPGAAAPAEGFAPLFLGSLSNSSTLVTTAADTQFGALAQAAQASIDVALYDFDRASVRDALLAAKARGVAVRVVGDDEDAALASYAPFYQSMTAAGIPLVTDSASALMHNKFAVFDGGVTWTGSANFSDNAFVRNGENVVVITSTVVASIYTAEFNEMFGGKFHGAKSDNTAHSATVAGSPVEIAFAPTDGVENRIIAALNSANESIKVAMFTFTSAPIAQALIAAKSRGVKVEVLLDGTADGSQFSQRDPLCAAGVTVRVETWASKLHDKYAVVDAGSASDPLILTGSTNWTANAVTANDENLLIVHDAGLANGFSSDFDRLRAGIAPGGFVCNAGPSPAPEPRAYLPLLQSEPAPTPPPGQAQITFIDAAPPVTLDEYVLIKNIGAGPQDMAGWKLSDAASNTYTFPAFTLPAGAEVRVWVKVGTDDAANLYWGRGSPVWNNTGDTATLRDAQGATVSTYTYP
jgi:phosphatidylserine/phosphatidylglycerophosphate/cardiolipin synthase-like enzyme